MRDKEALSNTQKGLILGAATAGLAALIIWLSRILYRPIGERSTEEMDTYATALNPEAGWAATPLADSSSQASSLVVKPTGAAPISSVPDTMDNQGPASFVPSATRTKQDARVTAGGALQRQTAAPYPATALRSTQWTSTTKYLVATGLVLAVVGLIYFSRGTLFLLIFAALLALIVRPLIAFFQNRMKIRRGGAVLLTYLLIVVALLLIPLVVLPNIASAINNLISMDWESASQAWITNLQQAAIQAANVPILGSSLENLLNSTAQLLQNASSQASSAPPVEVSLASAVGQFGKTLGLLVTLLGPIVSGTLALVFMLLISLQMSLASGEIRGWVMSIVPVRFKEEINALLDSILKIWMSFIGGQLTLMIVMGLLVWLLNVLLGTPQALLLGVISGLLEVIPSLGPLLAWIPAVILALLFGSSVFPEMDPLVFALVVSIGYFLVQSLENQLLVPSILGDAVDLPPLVVIIGVTIAGATLGVAGVFVATPLMSTGREIFQYLYTKLIDLGDQEPAPEPKPSIRDRLRSGIMRARQALRRKPKNLSPDLPS